MRSTISWLNENRKIALMQSAGLWDASALLESLKDVFRLEPDYFVWDPTEIIFIAEQLAQHEDSSTDRQELNNMIASALREGRLKLYFVIQQKASSAFDTMRDNARTLNVEDRVIFVKSLDEVTKIIANTK